MGEQGTENRHQMILSIELERGKVQGIRNVVTKLHHILTAHPDGAFSPKLNYMYDKHICRKRNCDNTYIGRLHCVWSQ